MQVSCFYLEELVSAWHNLMLLEGYWLFLHPYEWTTPGSSASVSSRMSCDTNTDDGLRISLCCPPKEYLIVGLSDAWFVLPPRSALELSSDMGD